MIKKIFEKIRKKDNGDTIGGYLPIIATTFVIAVLLMAFIGWMAAVNNKFDVNQVERKYILKLETQGYLTSSQTQDLKKELENCGMKEVQIKVTGQNYGDSVVNIENKPNTSLKYGATINLNIKGKLPVLTMGSNDKNKNFLNMGQIFSDQVIDNTVSSTLKN